MRRRPLGASGIEVSTLALGSWRTYERIPREQGIGVMHAARERGITFFDDARYNDESGEAQIRTGYSEVLFGELFRATGWRRDEVVVANKLWWEFWPDQSAAQELDDSLARMGFDYIDLAYSWTTPDGPPIETIVTSIGALITSGKLRAWGTGNWQPADDERAAGLALGQGIPPPCAAQLPYNLCVRDYVEFRLRFRLSITQVRLLSPPSSFTEACSPASTQSVSRPAAWPTSPPIQNCSRSCRPPMSCAHSPPSSNSTPAMLAIAFAMANERVATVLFGATTPEQVAENARAIEVLDRLDAASLAELRAIGSR